MLLVLLVLNVILLKYAICRLLGALNVPLNKDWEIHQKLPIGPNKNMWKDLNK